MYETCVRPSLACFVVIKITPFAPRDPYIAVEEASFSTSILSILLGSISRSEPYGTPSTNIKGAFDAFKDRFPRMVNEGLAPACPLLTVISIPAIFPCKLSRAFVVGIAVTSSDFILVTDPVKSRFLTLPYPTTTNSFNVLSSSDRLILRLCLEPSRISFELKPM